MKLRWATLGALGLGFVHVAGCQQILGFEDHTIVDGSAGSPAGSAGNPSGGSAGRATGGASSGSSGKGGSGASSGSGNSGGSGASAGSRASGGSGGASMGSGGDAGDTGSGGTGGDVSSGGSGGDGNSGSAGTSGAGGGKGGSSGKGGTGGTAGDGSGGANAGTGNTGTGGTGGTGGAGGGAGMSGGSAGAGMAGSSSTVPDPPPIVGGVTGWASRYWDCCKPTCGWEANVTVGDPAWSCSSGDTAFSTFTQQSSCSAGTAFLCSTAAPWAVSPTLSYGFAAGPGAADCGECYQIEFAGTTTHGAATANQAMLAGKKMIVQVLNRTDLPASQLDLLIPGGGVGSFSACASQWGTSDLGAQYGGWLAECANDTACVRQKCESAFADLPDFLAGCSWFLDWFHGANNPDLVYKQIACPAALTERSGLSDPG